MAKHTHSRRTRKVRRTHRRRARGGNYEDCDAIVKRFEDVKTWNVNTNNKKNSRLEDALGTMKTLIRHAEALGCDKGVIDDLQAHHNILLKKYKNTL